MNSIQQILLLVLIKMQVQVLAWSDESNNVPGSVAADEIIRLSKEVDKYAKKLKDL